MSKVKADGGNATADYTLKDTGNTTSTLDPQVNTTNSTKLDNTGAAVFLFKDSATGV
jgi:hypothetical protein